MKDKIPTRSEPHPVTYNDRLREVEHLLAKLSEQPTNEFIAAARGYILSSVGEPSSSKVPRIEMAIMNLNNWLGLRKRRATKKDYDVVVEASNILKDIVQEIRDSRVRRMVAKREKITMLDRAMKMVKK